MLLVDYDKLFLKADNLRNNAQVDEAIKFYLEIATLATQPDELPHRARALHMAGVSAKEDVMSIDSSYYRDAMNYFDQAEAVYRQLRDDGGLGSLYRDRAIINDYAGNYSESQRYFGESIKFLQAPSDAAGLGITYDKLGVHYYDQGDYATAERYIQDALKLVRREPSVGFLIATTLYDLARVKFKLNQLDAALDLALESLSWFEADHGQERYDRRLAQLEGLLSLIHYELGNQKAAEKSAGRYRRLLKTFDPLAAEVLEKDLKKLAQPE